MIKKRVLVIAGPTCSGESTITKLIIEKYPIFTRLTTATSRQPRLNEKDGIDYYFFSEKDFLKQIEMGNIIEHTYFKETNTYYGTYKKDLDDKLNAGLNIIINPDVAGAQFYKKNFNATTIFLNPGGLDIIKFRLTNRDKTISLDEVEKRLKTAKRELENEQKFYDYIVKNEQNKLKDAVNEIINILNKENYKLS